MLLLLAAARFAGRAADSALQCTERAIRQRDQAEPEQRCRCNERPHLSSHLCGLIAFLFAALKTARSAHKAFKKEFSCNGTIVDDPEYGHVIQLQGDQRQNVLQFLTANGIAKKDVIKIHGR